MKKKNLLAVVITALMATGCGGGGSDEQSGGLTPPSPPGPPPTPTNEPLDSQYYGIWELSGDAQILVSETSVITLARDPDNSCWEAGMFKVTSSTNSSIVSEDLVTGEQTETNFALDGQTLLATEDGVTLQFAPAQSINPTPACGSATASISNITLDLAYLPDSVTVNRDAQDSGRVEYDYGITFDVNQTQETDAGDIYIQLRHFKGAGSFDANQQVNLADLGASLWYSAYENSTDRLLTRTTSNDSFAVAVAQTGNQLNFAIDASNNALFSLISPDTPVNVVAFLSYPQPEPEVIEGEQDGPWNWSSDRHIDAAPGEDMFMIPANQANFSFTDANADWIEGEAQWVDLQSISFVFN